jgi:HEAT repeat protein
MVSMEELLNALIQRDPVQLSQTTLKNMLKEGKAGMLADLMMKHGKIFPAFLPLLTHDMWAIRLGAMVAFEQIADRDKDMAGEILATLMRSFDGMEDRVKGDMIYLLGQLGDEKNIPFLEAIKAETTNHEIRESVVEALERMGMEKGQDPGHRLHDHSSPP